MNTVFLDSTAIINAINNGNYVGLNALFSPRNTLTLLISTVYSEIVQGGPKNTFALEQIDRHLETALRSGAPHIFELGTPQLPRKMGGSRDAGEMSIAHVLNGGGLTF